MKKLLCLALSVMLMGSVFAQEQTDSVSAQPAKAKKPESSLRHYVEIGAMGGVSSFVGNPGQGYFAPGYNAGLGFYYVMRSMKAHVGLRTGLAAESSQAIFTSTGYKDSYMGQDFNGDDMQVDYTIGKLQETHTQVYFTIPLQFSAFGQNFNFHVGPKVAVTLADFTTQSVTNADLSCTNIVTGDVYKSNPLYSAGLIASQQTEVTKNNTFLPKVWLMLSSEISYDVVFGDRYALNFGIYADYAFNGYTAEASSNKSLLSLEQNAAGTEFVRVPVSALRANYQGNQLVEKFQYFTAGLKVSFKIWE